MKKDLESRPKEANMIAFEFAREYGSCSQARIKALQGIFTKNSSELFLAAGAFTGGGALYINYTNSISSIDINAFTSVKIFFIPLLGGKRSIYGPAIGALFCILVPELFSSIERYVDILYVLAYILFS